MPNPKNDMKFQTVQAVRAGQDMFWSGILPIGVAARDIPAGTEIDYNPNKTRPM